VPEVELVQHALRHVLSTEELVPLLPGVQIERVPKINPHVIGKMPKNLKMDLADASADAVVQRIVPAPP